MATQTHSTCGESTACGMCEFIGKNCQDLVLHIEAVHIDGSAKVCRLRDPDDPDKECLKNCKTLGDLKKHQATKKHGSQSSHKCRVKENRVVCGKTFQHKRTLKAHQRDHHTRSSKPTCDICQQTFSTFGALKTHGKTNCWPSKIYASASRPQQCPICPPDKLMTFSKPALYKRHMVIHETGESSKPYKCLNEGCSKGFAQKSNMHRHMKICKK